MSDNTVQYKSEKLNKKVVYYTGTETVSTGYAFCYDRDYGTAASADVARAYKVEKPATANLKFFAGVLAEESSGKTGPCWLTIIEPKAAPGCICSAYTYANSTILVTKLGPTNGQWYLAAASSANPAAAIAMQTLNTSGTAALTQVQLEGVASLAMDSAAYVAPLTGTLTGTTDGALADIAAAAGNCAGTSSPSAANVDTAIATAVATIVTGTNTNLKEIQATLTAIQTALVNANLMAAS